MKGLNFGQAIEALKRGEKVCRAGWNGKGMYLWLLAATMVKKEWVKDPMLLEVFGESDSLSCLGSIRMKTATGEVLTGWLASQSDILGEDWEIIGEQPNKENEPGVREIEKYYKSDITGGGYKFRVCLYSMGSHDIACEVFRNDGLDEVWIWDSTVYMEVPYTQLRNEMIMQAPDYFINSIVEPVMQYFSGKEGEMPDNIL